ncbi:hypothetical protein ABFV99_02270 [Cytobacillus horneckiae]|uniref:hypothetical protein n=1 Tax=Cytobacillus horneckiae TaxID=549687 RepID=UPI0034D0120F
MIYTIDVSEFLGTSHRLKQDGLFKKFESDDEKEILEDDLTFDDYYKAKNWMANNKFVELDGKQIAVNPESYSLTDPTVSIRPHRTGKPKQSFFTEDDLKKVLLAGNDNYNNSLVVDFDGFLHLVPFKQGIDGAYAVRFETFGAGNGYVGSENSLNHIDETYLSLLEAWEIHLIGHDFVYRDYPTNKTKEVLLEEIKTAINNL